MGTEMIAFHIKNISLAVEQKHGLRLTVFGYDGGYAYQIVNLGTGEVWNSPKTYRCEANAKRFGRARLAKMADGR